MGVPAFYKWLAGKYPKTVVNAVEERVGEGESVDTTQPNPNGIEFDNLYLDMNGIVHPCFHPDKHLFSPATFDEVFNSIFEYIDRLFSIVRPRNLLFMAIDGVAPRAKMNQQRCRRFQAAKSAELAEAEEDKLRREFQLVGKEVLPKKPSEVSDSNVITPGTEFMYRLSKALKYYIHLRLTTDPGWRKIKVILSDANVPGEGEHKIMSFIRQQRNCEGYNPNTHHCLYGLDADLIMLALATHEVYFSILREDVTSMDQQTNCILSLETSLSKLNAYPVKSRTWFGKVHLTNGGNSLAKTPYQFLNIWTLREYLELDMMTSETPKDFVINFERVIDDFIFLCFFMGNDFLPCLPSLDIREGGIDLLMAVYKAEFKSMGGYIVNTCRLKDKHAAYIKFKRVERFILAVGSYEDKIFKKRSEIWQRKIRRIMREMSEDMGEEDLYDQHKDRNHQQNSRAMENGLRGDHHRMPNDLSSVQCPEADVIQNTKELLQKLKDVVRQKSDLFKTGNLVSDKVRYGSEGFKPRYYKAKFSVEKTDEIESKRKQIVQKYAEGLCWVLRYYFEGVCSWSWYYDHHYGPFASDCKGISGARINFQLGTPFKPFTQLLAVLPPKSANVLPQAYRDLMTRPESNIIDFYPNDFEVDTECKRYMWQAVMLLEFIDEKRLLLETGKLESKLKDDEVKRNSVNYEMIFVSASHDFGSQVSVLCRQHEIVSENEMMEKVAIDCVKSGLNGFLMRCDGYSCTDDSSLMDFNTKSVVCAAFENPVFDYHIPEPPKNIKMPDKTITEADIEETQLWHENDFTRPRYKRFSPRPRNVPEPGRFGTRPRKVIKPDKVGKLNSPRSHRETWKEEGLSSVHGRGASSQENFQVGPQWEIHGGISPRDGGFGQGRNSFPAGRSGNWNFDSKHDATWYYGGNQGSGDRYFERSNISQTSVAFRGLCVGDSSFHANGNQGRGNGSFGRSNFSQTSEAFRGLHVVNSSFHANGNQGRRNGSFGRSNFSQTSEAFRGLRVGDSNFHANGNQGGGNRSFGRSNFSQTSEAFRGGLHIGDSGFHANGNSYRANTNGGRMNVYQARAEFSNGAWGRGRHESSSSRGW